MSHVHSCTVPVTDLDSLERACARVPGMKLVRGATSYRWWGHWADDSPVPDGIFTEEETARIRKMTRDERCAVMNARLGRCEHKVSVAGSRYEVGVVKRDDGKGYSLVSDWYGERELLDKLAALQQQYSLDRIQTMGYEVESTTELESGDVRVRLYADARY